MSEIIDAVESPVEPMSWGDWLQAPQEWCSRQWQHLTFSQASLPELGALIFKVAALVVATPFCYLVGFAGSMIKFFTEPPKPPITPKSMSIQLFIDDKKLGEKFSNDNQPLASFDFPDPGSEKSAERFHQFNEPFHKIYLNVPGHLEIVQGEENSLTISAGSNFLDVLETTVQDDKLTLGVKPNSSYVTYQDMRYKLKVSNLAEATISGMGDVFIPSLSTEKFSCRVNSFGKLTIGQAQIKEMDVTVSDSGNFKISELFADRLKMDMSGFGNATIDEGQVKQQEIHHNGSGDYNALHLPSEHATVSISSYGNADIHATRSLDVNISGSGNCSYKGSPFVIRSITGLGTLRHR